MSLGSDKDIKVSKKIVHFDKKEDSDSTLDSILKDELDRKLQTMATYMKIWKAK